MCAIDDAEPWKVSREQTRRARRQWGCCECRRAIAGGEQHQHLTGKTYDGDWLEYRWCRHCDALGVWMTVVCGGYPLGGLFDELVEHWREGYATVAFGRLIIGMRRQWRGGDAAVPTDVAELARQMLADQVQPVGVR